MFRIDLVSPPFAGHLFPLLEMGSYLQQQGFEVRVLSTARASEAVRLSNLKQVVVLAEKDAAIAAVADPPYQVKHHPGYLLRQFEGNLALMKDLQKELKSIWQPYKPDLVIADFTLPLAGILAQTFKIPWWTSLPTPCALESRTGTPSYLGGWTPGKTPFHALRDLLGRKSIRGFKHFIAWRYLKALAELGITALYRPDGTEMAYSPTRILALGMPEFEFKREWPASLQFVGPLTASPPFEHIPPTLMPGKKHIFVSLGTHIPWAKTRALQFTRTLAQTLPECQFHFSYGKPGQLGFQQEANLSIYDYIPYNEYLHHYDVAIIHGGTGLTYSCMQVGLPMLVWPHDYDQFDHAARIVYHGLGLKTNGQLQLTIDRLQRLLGEDGFRRKGQIFKQYLERYDTRKLIEHEVQNFLENTRAE